MEKYAFEKRDFARLARVRCRERRATSPTIDEIQAEFARPDWNESTIAHKECPFAATPPLPLTPRPPRQPKPPPRSIDAAPRAIAKSPQNVSFREPIVEPQKFIYLPPIVQPGWRSPRSSLRNKSPKTAAEDGKSDFGFRQTRVVGLTDCSQVNIEGLPPSPNNRTIIIKTHRSYSVVDDVTGMTQFSGVATAVNSVPIDAELNALVFEESQGHDFQETMKFASCCATKMASRGDTAFLLSESTLSNSFVEPRRSPRLQARRKRKADDEDNKETKGVAPAETDLDVELHEPVRKRRKAVSTAKKVICKSLKVFATIPIELSVEAGIGQYKAKIAFRKTPEQRQLEVRESMMGSPARRAIAFDDHDGDMVFSPRRLITPRRHPFTPRQQLTSRYVELSRL
ncbi:unnamed protein product, partial [Oikopleura dioica]